MDAFVELVSANEAWLIERVLTSARHHGYASYLPPLPEAWQITICSLSAALVDSSSASSPSHWPFAADYDPLLDPVACFGMIEAQRHRERGVTLERYLGLVKHYRQAYLDLLAIRGGRAGLGRDQKAIIGRFFDRFEMGVSCGWARTALPEMSIPVFVPPQMDASQKKYRELMLLYRVSNTMLTTIRLNKLIHLILTALTAGDDPFFDRAILFMTNERSGFMQGMLGVTRDTSVPSVEGVADPTDILGSSWDLSEDDMQRQQESDFSREVRGCRLKLDKKLNISSLAVMEKRMVYVADVAKERRVDLGIVERLGVTSFAVAPLIAKEKVFGVVMVDNALSGRRISQAELGFLQIFTNQAGAAIENAMLYTRLEEANRSLREAQERLIHGERLATIGEMAASLAHELKGPLVSIGGFAKRLCKQLPTTVEAHDTADLIAKEVLRLEKLLGDILSFGRKTTLCYDRWILQDLVEESLAVVSLSCAEQRIAIERRFATKPLQIIADGQQLKQVFLNLFFNAQEAMAGKGGGRLTVAISSSRMRGMPAVTIKIADTGGGVPDHHLQKLFAAFFTTKEAGTGLGLPIAHRIVTNHRGTIQVCNEAGDGLVFTITLPQQP